MASAIMECLRQTAKSSPAIPIKALIANTVDNFKQMKYTKKYDMQELAEGKLAFDLRTSKKRRLSSIYVIDNATEPSKEISLPIANMGTKSILSKKKQKTEQMDIQGRCEMASYLKQRATPLPTSSDNKFFSKYMTDDTIDTINSNIKKRRKMLKSYIKLHKHNNVSET